ncbi:MAG: 4Fe-4S dicluster domain-containing protein [Thermodesulfobacteriota bacterium]
MIVLNCDRRRFLRAAAGASGLVLLAGLFPPLAAAGEIWGGSPFPFDSRNSLLREGLLVRLGRCDGCGRCVEACREANTISGSGSRIVVYRRQDGAGAGYLPVMCSQCERPPCVDVCPTKASMRDSSGRVVIDRKLCIGCYACLMACPYNARYFNAELRAMDACDFCADYRKRSGRREPACVARCPRAALSYGSLDDPGFAGLVESMGRNVLRPDRGTDPRVFYAPAG